MSVRRALMRFAPSIFLVAASLLSVVVTGATSFAAPQFGGGDVLGDGQLADPCDYVTADVISEAAGDEFEFDPANTSASLNGCVFSGSGDIESVTVSLLLARAFDGEGGLLDVEEFDGPGERTSWYCSDDGNRCDLQTVVGQEMVVVIISPGDADDARETAVAIAESALASEPVDSGEIGSVLPCPDGGALNVAFADDDVIRVIVEPDPEVPIQRGVSPNTSEFMLAYYLDGQPAEAGQPVIGAHLTGLRSYSDSSYGTPGEHTVTVVLTRGDNVACAARGSVSFTVERPPEIDAETTLGRGSDDSINWDLGWMIPFVVVSGLFGALVLKRESGRFGLDATDPFILHVGGAGYTISSATGRVDGYNKTRSSTVAGSVQGNVYQGTGYVTGSVSTTHHVHDQFFLNLADGTAHRVQVDDLNLAVANDQLASAVWAKDKYLLFRNHKARETAFSPRGIKTILKANAGMFIWPVLLFLGVWTAAWLATDEPLGDTWSGGLLIAWWVSIPVLIGAAIVLKILTDRRVASFRRKAGLLVEALDGEAARQESRSAH